MSDHECSRSRMTKCRECKREICNICCSNLYCSKYCQIEHLFRDGSDIINTVVCNCVIYSNKWVNSYYSNIIEYQRTAICSIESQHKKEKVWKLFYLKQHLIKDIVNIVIEY